MRGVAVHLDPDVKLWPLTVADVDRMVADGSLGEDDRVELLDGVLVEVSPQSPEHSAVLSALIMLLVPPAAAQDLSLLSQAPLLVARQSSRPEPDVAVVRRPEPGRHPSEALLVVEIAISSRQLDLNAKAAIYAEAGVPDYWVVDVAAREVVVHREPAAGRYALIRRVREGEVVDAALLPVTVAVAALLADVAPA